MNMRRIKKSLCFGLAAVMAFSGTGCVKSELAELTEEEKNLYVEYAANAVLKHDRNYIDRMQEVELETETEDITEGQSYDGQNSSEQNAAENGTAAVMSMNDIFGLSGIDIQTNGYEVADSYPSNGKELGMSMVAVKGYRLLVLKFNITNTAGADVTLNMMDSGAAYRGIINDSVKMNAQVTALLDAFNTYSGTIPAGSTQEMVLVFQINENDAENISSVKLNIIYNDKQGTVVIN